ncbi:NADH-quinone oxidoreductase subunit N [Geomonas sp. RF6]|uniref:NADH-quinone oxidoreductase subunit N n=1 Tax=Geomonas sp. RF6 TaxID=2897342 RepID=UPI001E4842C6|nr:NADH-quinone oxidoreductase subunit N [Geomonas sp. RF6]UFS72028.1 NADH-quinone oxidoreductase subunit N [Geomonas sp. RF6]
MTQADAIAMMPIIITAAAALLVLICGPFLPRGIVSGASVAAAVAAGVWAACTPASPSLSLPGVGFPALARFLIPVVCFGAAMTMLLSHSYNTRREVRGEEFAATVLFSLFAMCVLPCGNNLLILFLALESITFSFYILVSMDLHRLESGEAGLKYLLIGAVAAAIIAFGIALFYVGSGTLSLQALQPRPENRIIISAGWGMVLLGLAFKLSLVPAHLWTPDVYQGAPAPVAAFLSTGSKVTALALFLLLLSLLPPIEELRAPLFFLSLASMVLGNLAALLQQDVKRMLAYSSIAQMGYLALAILTGTREGYAAVLLYAVIYTAMNLAAFGAISSLSGAKERSLIAEYSGVGYSAPFRGGVLALSMLALAGIPPTAGFMGKFFIFYSAVRGGEMTLAIIGICTAAASAYFYLRVVVYLYMRTEPAPQPSPVTVGESAALSLCSLLIIVIGVYPAPLLRLVDAALR